MVNLGRKDEKITILFRSGLNLGKAAGSVLSPLFFITPVFSRLFLARLRIRKLALNVPPPKSAPFRKQQPDLRTAQSEDGKQ